MWKVYNIETGKTIKAGFSSEDAAKDWLDERQDMLQQDYEVEEMDEDEEAEYDFDSEEEDAELESNSMDEEEEDEDAEPDDEALEMGFHEDEDSVS